MNEKENHIIYTAADIEQYLSGKLSSSQMHAMEKAALDDAFLAEAIEGYAGIQQEDWKKGLADLNHNFATRATETKVVAMGQRKNNWWKIAAAVLLLATTAGISYILINKKDTGQFAQETPAAKTNATITTADSTTGAAVVITPPATNQTPTAPAETAISKTADGIVLRKEKVVPAADTDKVADSLFVYTPAAELAKEKGRLNAEKPAGDIALNKSVPPAASAPEAKFFKKETKAAETNYANTVSPGVVNNNGNNNLFFDKSKNVGYQSEGLSNLKKEQQLNQNFRAQVVGADNTPLPFANITIKNENFGTYADVKGFFNLVSSDSALTVEVKAAGYQPRFYTLQSYAQQNKIVLAEQDVTANYKAVTGSTSGGIARNKMSRKATLLKDSVVNVEPADGWDNYNTYVNNNLDIPDDILQKNIHGQVELSFDVQSNGTITNIKVDKSLCDNCDEVAKRLIQQGPQWKVKKGKNRKGKVTVQF